MEMPWWAGIGRDQSEARVLAPLFVRPAKLMVYSLFAHQRCPRCASPRL